MSKNDAALNALGIKKGVTYSVVPVFCTETKCMYNTDCQDNAIGLSPSDTGGYMICHDYMEHILDEHKDKRVFWQRKKAGRDAP